MTASEANKLSITDLKKYLLDNWFDGDDSSKYCNRGDKETMVMHRLVQICEKYEQGLIIESPVPIGTEIWIIVPFRDTDGNKTYSIQKSQMLYMDLEYWGDLAFATRKEAEVRLKELRGEE